MRIRNALCACLALLTLSGAATGQAVQNEQLIRSVERELPRYITGVDVRSLETSQLAALHLALYRDSSFSEIRSEVRSIIGGLDVLLFGRNLTFR